MDESITFKAKNIEQSIQALNRQQMDRNNLLKEYYHLEKELKEVQIL
jgi:hypothetical protein